MREPQLIRIGYALEQLLVARVPPKLLGSVPPNPEPFLGAQYLRCPSGLIRRRALSMAPREGCTGGPGEDAHPNPDREAGREPRLTGGVGSEGVVIHLPFHWLEQAGSGRDADPYPVWISQACDDVSST